MCAWISSSLSLQEEAFTSEHVCLHLSVLTRDECVLCCAHTLRACSALAVDGEGVQSQGLGTSRQATSSSTDFQVEVNCKVVRNGSVARFVRDMVWTVTVRASQQRKAVSPAFIKCAPASNDNECHNQQHQHQHAPAEHNATRTQCQSRRLSSTDSDLRDH
jgi:hypothetical protein